MRVLQGSRAQTAFPISEQLSATSHHVSDGDATDQRDGERASSEQEQEVVRCRIRRPGDIDRIRRLSIGGERSHAHRRQRIREDVRADCHRPDHERECAQV